MIADPDNFFAPLVLGPGLTPDARAELISDAINRNTPEKPPQIFNYKLGCIGEYNAFKRIYAPAYKDALKKYHSVNLSPLLHQAMELEKATARIGMDGDVETLRDTLDGIRARIADEKETIALMNAPNARLTEIYTVLHAAEKKMPVMQFSVLHETSEKLRLLAHMRDMPRWEAQHARIENILAPVEFIIHAIASYQQSEQEKKNLRGHLKTSFGTATTIAAPAIARFRRRPQVQP